MRVVRNSVYHESTVRFDELNSVAQNRGMDQDVYAVLRAYPQIYLAYHVEHRTRASSPTGLTERDSSLLAHVDEQGSSPAALASRRGGNASAGRRAWLRHQPDLPLLLDACIWARGDDAGLLGDMEKALGR